MEEYTLDSYASETMDDSLSTIAEENSEGPKREHGLAPEQGLVGSDEWPADENGLDAAPLKDVESALDANEEMEEAENIEVDLDFFGDDLTQEPPQKRRRPKFAMLAVCCAVLLGVVFLVVGVTASSDKSDRSADVSALNESESAAETSPPVASGTADGGNDGTTPTTPNPVNQPTSPPAVAPVSPTEAPVPSPTEAPTPSPTKCVATISTDAVCYGQNRGDIVVSFQQCSPLEDDWVGIYPEGSGGASLGADYHEEWKWACGDRACRGETLANTITLDATGVLPGWYELHLARDSVGEGPPYESVAFSEKIFVTNGDCPNS